MKIEDIKTGMRVRIAKDISITKDRHSASEPMYNMRGKVYNVSSVLRSSVRIRGFIWAPEDIQRSKPLKSKSQIFHYDIKNLSGVCHEKR